VIVTYHAVVCEAPDPAPACRRQSTWTTTLAVVRDVAQSEGWARVNMDRDAAGAIRRIDVCPPCHMRGATRGENQP
jgi:hypothetical protein